MEDFIIRYTTYCNSEFGMEPLYIFIVMEDFTMIRNVVKKIVSVVMCVSVLAGYASISNAYSINAGAIGYVGTAYASSGGGHSFSYEVSYIYYNDLAVGAYLYDLSLKADMNVDSDKVCNINMPQKSGTYHVTSSGSHTYNLHNDTSKHVYITFDYLNY
ncbi:MAG: hypothetical protein K5665_04200 [Saccharofermentans sp.]|nr:hypothetical protein [Saccharofermentans sp.]